MLHKVWNSKGEMPYSFPRSSIKFQGHTGQNITDFDPNWAFPNYRPVAAFKSLRTVTPVWIQIWWWNDAQSLMLLRRGALLFFKVICNISRSQEEKNRLIWPNLSVSGLKLKSKSTNGYGMMHKAWMGIEEVPYWFSRSSVKFQGHRRRKIVNLTQFERFRTVTQM